MRAFIVLALIAVARANGGGYTYGTGSNGGYSSNGGGSIGGGSIGGSSFTGGSINSGSIGGSSFGGASFGGGSFGGGSYGGGSIGGGSIGGSSSGGGSIGGGGSFNNVGQGRQELNKEFFTFSAPESEFDDDKQLGDVSSSLKQNLRVIFIRAPENNGLANAALNLAKSSVDSRTAIYVLHKQADISDLANKLQNINNHNANKPEVHFVKYRTPEDAVNAQRKIQAQYDALGGTSASHNGGVAPVLNFASQAPSLIAGVNNAYIAPAEGAQVNKPSGTYLPITKH